MQDALTLTEVNGGFLHAVRGIRKYFINSDSDSGSGFEKSTRNSDSDSDSESGVLSLNIVIA